jgi:hypothetical protein
LQAGCRTQRQPGRDVSARARRTLSSEIEIHIGGMPT